MANGIVHLVGAGPGDPGLMTARSLELIASADAILYDRLIPVGALDGARPDAERIYVGKEPGRPAMSQRRICELLVELGQAPQRVVRLKGGDPFVFGRGGEEAEALREAGIQYEVVPGVTSGVAAPAFAGIPVTHRELASAVAFVTGHEDPGKEQGGLDWEALAAFPGTLVIYMGVGNLRQISKRLVAAGRDPDEPAAVIQSGTLPAQRTVTGPLREIAPRAARAEVVAPAITVIGPAAGMRETLAWVERRPLYGRRVAVTRARAQASGLADRLRELGAEVIETPSIRIVPRAVEGEIAAAIDALGSYALICLTSPNGVARLFAALATRGRDARAFAGARVAAIGPGTARELERRGVRADVVPARAIAEALVEALAAIPVAGERVLVARAGEARDVLPDALRERGAEVDVVGLYDTVVEPLSDEQRGALADTDYVTFTSASTVRNLLGSLGDADPLGSTRLVSIGPVTSAAARELGLTVNVEAERHDVDGLVAALIGDVMAGAT